MDPNKD